MRVYISVDMEGVAGVVHLDQARCNGMDYPKARELMTDEANAAALGAFEAGAAEVVVNDAHADMRNLLLERLDPRCRIVLGDGKPLSMVQGVEEGPYAAALFIGYHAGMGQAAAVMDHTYYGGVTSRVRINGREVNEAAINALVAGDQGTPVALVTGDEAACREARALIPGVRTVAVKRGVTRYSASTLHPEEARKRIREASREAVSAARGLKPLRWKAPYLVELDMLQSALADAASLMPGVERRGGRNVAYKARTVPEAFRALLAMIRLGATGMADIRPK